MENYKTILTQFAEIGYHEELLLDEYAATLALDKLRLANTSKTDGFSRYVAEEIFEQTPKNEEGEALLREYASTILEAHNLLKKHIYDHREKVKLVTDEDEKEKLASELQQFEEDYALITETFVLPNSVKTRADSKASIGSRVSISSKASIDSNISDIFADSKKMPNESYSLKITLVVALTCFLLEFLLMFEKHHFLSMLTYVAILSIFLLDFFDKVYVRVVLYLLGAAAFLDFLWVILQADHFWNVEGASQHSSQHTGYLRFVYIMTIISLAAKVVMAYFLFRYRSMAAGTCRVVRLFNFRFDLSGETASPVSALLAKSV